MTMTPELQDGDLVVLNDRHFCSDQQLDAHAEARRRCREHMADLRVVLRSHIYSGQLPQLAGIVGSILDDYYGRQYERTYLDSLQAETEDECADGDAASNLEPIEGQLNLALPNEESDVLLKPEEQQMLEFLSEGHDLQFVATDKGYSSRGVARRHAKMLHKLRAKTDAHAVRRRFEAGGSWDKPLAIDHAWLAKSLPLEPEEKECLRLISLGKSRLEIVERMNYAESSITRICGNAIQKLGGRNKAHAVRIGLQADILTLEPDDDESSDDY